MLRGFLVCAVVCSLCKLFFTLQNISKRTPRPKDLQRCVKTKETSKDVRRERFVQKLAGETFRANSRISIFTAITILFSSND